MRILLLLLCILGCQSESLAYGQWEQLADFGSFGRHRAVAIGIGNRVFAGTGHLNGTGFDTWYPDWWEYDPASDSWAQKSDYPGNNGNGDQDCVAIAVGDYVYMGMGQLSGNDFYRFDPQTNSWTSVTNPPGSSFTNTFPFVINGKGYFPTLYSSLFYEYDPTLDQWTQLNNLPFSTVYGIPTFAINDKGYIKNGVDFWEYDPTIDLWTAKAPFPGLYPHRSRGIDQYGYGFFIGGFQGSPTALPWTWAAEVWRYDPSNDSWLQLDDFPGTTRRWAVIAKINNHVYYGLGTNGTNFHDFWEFDAMLSTPEQAIDEVQVFPTLADQEVHFEGDVLKKYEVQIVNSQGKKVYVGETHAGKLTAQRGDIPAGMYLYQISVDNAPVHSGRLVFR